MAFFDKFRTNVDGLQQAKDYPGLVAVLNSDDPPVTVPMQRGLSPLSGGFPPSRISSGRSNMPVPRHVPGWSNPSFRSAHRLSRCSSP
ncbi:hypothetical protein [Methanoculleus chikugoensis]|uniref:hypothetical protein n=1 Tax=Methanoculleus chikugoensis TaxID=118126 RepID=UPI0006CF21DF|nr:hypothetical protein [Methanoculleus chikugoensis]